MIMAPTSRSRSAKFTVPGVIEAHRKAIDSSEEVDPVTQDMLIGQAAEREQLHWFVRAHLENAAGSVITAGATTGGRAASRARR
jgi:starvation-inducible DNA-binding protein